MLTAANKMKFVTAEQQNNLAISQNSVTAHAIDFYDPNFNECIARVHSNEADLHHNLLAT